MSCGGVHHRCKGRPRSFSSIEEALASCVRPPAARARIGNDGPEDDEPEDDEPEDDEPEDDEPEDAEHEDAEHEDTETDEELDDVATRGDRQNKSRDRATKNQQHQQHQQQQKNTGDAFMNHTPNRTAHNKKTPNLFTLIALAGVLLGVHAPARADRTDGHARDMAPIALTITKACAIVRDGTVACWGTSYGSTPVALSGLSDVAGLAASEDSFCAVRADGTVACWGSNQYGELGDGTTTAHSTPATVSGLSNVVAVAGMNHAFCARRADGSVRCWGRNHASQIGDGTTTTRLSPVSISISGVTSLGGGGEHMCAGLASGGVRCWGDNTYGQTGQTTGFRTSTPTAVSSLSNVRQVTASWGGSCALLGSGLVQCWGINWFGELGRGGTATTGANPTPANVTGLDHVVGLSHGAGRTMCAIRSDDGQLWCWGGDTFGQLGDGTLSATAGYNATPARITSFGDRAVYAAASSSGGPELGFGFNCGLRGDGTIRCAGENNAGQVGDGTTTDRNVYVAVTLPTPAWNGQDVIAGEFASCAQKDNGTVRCWGDNTYGELGDGTNTQRLTATAATGLFTTARSLTANSGDACVLMTDGSAACTGNGAFGALGNGSTLDKNAFTDVNGLLSFTGMQMSAGADHTTCAALSTGSAKCWGDNAAGQVGDGTTTQRLTPVTVSGLSNVVQVATGGGHACALLTGGSVRCWGQNADGQLGDGTNTQRLTSVAVSGLFTSAVSIAAGTDHTCAQLADGTVQCWGLGAGGQLGSNGTFSTTSPVDVVVSGGGLLANVTALSATDDHTCAVVAGGGVYCWGGNHDGQLGDGSTTTRLVATPVSSLTMATRIAAGWDHTCARKANGTVFCWGDNIYGDVGDGTTTQRLTPTQTSSFP